jgi:hypothetical protein
MIIWPAFWRIDMEFHKGISSSGKLYGLGSFAALDEDIIKHIETSEELDSGIYRSI